MPLSSALRFFWCVVWSHGTCGIQTNLRVSADYMSLNSGVFPSTLLHMPYPNRGVVWRSVHSVFTRLLPRLLLFFLFPQDMCICMLSVVSPSPKNGLFFPPRGDANRNTQAPRVAVYMLLHKVQPGPVPKYRFFCLSARDTVCPSGCDVLRS